MKGMNDMKQKALLCLVLCFLLVAALFTGCADENNGGGYSEATENISKNPEQSGTDSTANVSSDSSTSGTTSEDSYLDSTTGLYVSKNLPEFKDEWKSYSTFRVLVCSNESQTTYYSEEIEPLYDTTDEAITGGVTKRNDWIYDNYGITVKAIPVANVPLALAASISAYDCHNPSVL